MNEYQKRTMACAFTAVREENGEMRIEGYFAKFNDETELWPGAYEEIVPGAFDKSIGGDIRALVNHDTGLVLGRTKANTLTLRTDAIGLWGSILINPRDQDAVNAHARVERGDVTQASFGFNPIEETTEHREDGTIKWWLKEAELHEVTVCTFPAYENTELSARQAQAQEINEKRLESEKHKLKQRLEALKNGA